MCSPRCVWNATVAVYSPYTNTVLDVLEIPGTSVRQNSLSPLLILMTCRGNGI